MSSAKSEDDKDGVQEEDTKDVQGESNPALPKQESSSSGGPSPNKKPLLTENEEEVDRAKEETAAAAVGELQEEYHIKYIAYHNRR